MTEWNRKVAISAPFMGELELDAVRRPIMDGWLTQGPRVREFEQEFAKLICAEHAIATTNCTTALHLILAAMNIGPGDEVIVPAFTWVATANVVLYVGARPVLVDVDRSTFNAEPEMILASVGPKTKAVIVVHLFGRCVDVERLREMLPPQVAVIEDAACAAGASLRGRFAGTLGDAAAFSFHPRKSVTMGEGGMVTTKDAALAEKIRVLRNHGASISEEERHTGPRPYLLPSFNVLGFNYRMTDLQGAIGVVQIQRLPQLLEERRYWANWYSERLAAIEWLRVPAEVEMGQHGWQAYVLYVLPELAPCGRNEIMEALAEKGVATRPGTHAIHMLDLYRGKYGLVPDDFPGARDCDQHSMAVPLHNRMDEEDFRYVVDALGSLS